jgi:hypothetical protein
MSSDVAIVGAGAAGLATAIFAKRRHPNLSVLLLDGATKIGAKILVSGGGRCNVTNSVVTEKDFYGGSRNVVRRLLREFDAARAAEFFREIGVPLHEEPGGKLFPDSNQARSVLEALLKEAELRGVRLVAGRRVTGVKPGFEVVTAEETYLARRVVLATGGQSLPKTGSDGFGYKLAASLGHSIVPPTPGLVPLVLEGGFHAPLSGISHEVQISCRVDGAPPEQFTGAMLWTHFGASGPAAMNISRIWHRASLESRPVRVVISFLPRESPESTEGKLLELARSRPTSALATLLGEMVPARVGEALLRCLGVDGATRMAHLPKEDRRRIARALTDWPLPVAGTRGYNYAEVTAGGVPLDEIDPRTMASRTCPGLHLVGEILDVDGRIGGFNFQWSWSTGWVCAGGLA